jgi:hypothetical protein
MIQGALGYLPTLAAVWVGTGLVSVLILLWRTRARNSALRWAARNGGAEDLESQDWPWTDPQRKPQDVRVDFAVRAMSRGLPIVIAEVGWKRDGLGGATERSSGHGIAAVLTLPDAYPDTAVQRRRSSARRTGDAFGRQFRILVEDPIHADRLSGPALREAHTSGRIPPWTIHGGVLYTVQPGRGYLNERRAAAAAAQLHHIAELIGALPEPH